MIAVSDAYLEAVTGASRAFQARITLNGATQIPTELIKSIVIRETVNADGSLTMGNACSSEATIAVFKSDSTNIPYQNSQIYIEIGLEVGGSVEWIPAGTFFVADVKSSGALYYTLTAYDGMSKLEDPFDASSIAWPASIQVIAESISGATGVSLDSTYDWTPYTTYIIQMDSIDPSYTNRQMIGYIAGMMGKNATFSRNGVLTFKWYTDTERSIDLDNQYMNGFTKLMDSETAVYSISAGTRDNMFSAGDGVGIIFDNPFITQDMVNSIYESAGNMAYLPSTIKWRGDPALEAGDIITAEWLDGSLHDVLLMSHTLSYNGGVNSTITCYGYTETIRAMSQSPTDNKLNLLYYGLTKGFQEATNKIAGVTGGYYALEFNSAGFPTGWRISDTPEILPTSKVWRFNFGGLAFSSNGGATYSNVALTNDGQINADMITAGRINTNMLVIDNGTGTTDFSEYIRVSGGTMEFGKTDSAVKLNLDNDQVAYVGESEDPMAQFTPTTFEIENPQLVRFGKFGFILHPQGNMSITKVVDD